MAENPITITQITTRGLPAFFQTRFKYFLRAWLVIPDSDRCHLTMSGRAINEHQPITPREYQIMRELILRDNFAHAQH